MEKRLIPEVRFKGFKWDWEEDQLGNRFDITMGQSPKGEYYTDNPNDIILVQGNADIKNGKIFPRVWTKQATKISNPGEIILTVRAPVGAVAINDFKVVLGRGVCSIKGNKFVYHKLIEMEQNNYWSRYSTGSTFDSINSSDIKSAKLFFPKADEQEKIGRLFESLDQTIDLQGKVVEENKRLKQALLQKLFPKKGQKLPDLRLKSFSGNWEEKKVESLLSKFGSGGTPKSTEPKFYNGDIPFLSITDITNSNGVIRETEKRITKLGLDNSTAWIVPSGSISLAMYASVGKVAKLAIDSATSQAFFNMIVSESTDVEYLFQYLKYLELTNGWRKLISTGTQPNLNAKKIREFKIPIPSLPEQEAIGNLFKSLDEKIEREEERLEGYKTLKKSFLQKMFV